MSEDDPAEANVDGWSAVSVDPRDDGGAGVTFWVQKKSAAEASA